MKVEQESGSTDQNSYFICANTTPKPRPIRLIHIMSGKRVRHNRRERRHARESTRYVASDGDQVGGRECVVRQPRWRRTGE